MGLDRAAFFAAGFAGARATLALSGFAVAAFLRLASLTALANLLVTASTLTARFASHCSLTLLLSTRSNDLTSLLTVVL